MSTFGTLTGGLEKKYKAFTILCPLVMIGEVLLETFIPMIMSKIIDVGIANQDIHTVLRLGSVMIGASCVSLVCGAFGARFAAIASQGFSRNLRRKLFAKVQDFSFANIDRFSAASLVTRLTTDVTNVQNVYQMIIRICIRSPLMLISGTVMAFYLNRRLAPLFLIAIPFLGCVLAIITTTAYPRFRSMLTKYDKMNTIVQENLIAIRVVKSFVRGEFEIQKFEDSAAAVRNAQARAEKIVTCNMPIMQLVIYSSIVSVLWFGGNMIITGQMHTGELVSFIAYVTQVLMSLMMLSMIFVMFVLSRASINRIMEVLTEEVDIKDPDQFFSIVTDGSIRFKNVSFSYNHKADNCVLQDVSFSIPSGSLVGIIGSTGSSKSTLVQLIPRLYDVDSGMVQVGGVDVRKYKLESLRSAVAMVLQKNVLFSGTISENLRWGNDDATDDELISACKAADAHDFIMSFPQGYQTELGQGGVNLSGGQKQRLCIARALLKKPKVLILDDSTSAVDTATDSRIRKALRTQLPDTTKLIIAQRISSVQDADCIYVIDNGKIDGFGTHEQLLQNNAIYREVYQSQQKGDDD
ncbi:MAG: ABC transporter ATP-binding protein/permease [Treponema sp.]|nr:ABC transporter ATP-binding protein/permease [Treponema sp.]